MQKKSTWERIQDALTREGALAGIQFVSMFGIGAAVGSAEAIGTGPAALLTAGVTGSTVAFSGLIEYTNQKNNKQRLLDIYHEEIAALNGKSSGSLTIADLETPASCKNPAIYDALKMFEKRRDFYIGVHAVTALLLTTAIGIASFASGMVAPLAVAGVAGLLYEQTYKTMKSLGNAIFHTESERTVTRSIREIADQIGLGGRISSTRVLGVFIEANKDLAAKVKEKFGGEFMELTIAQKRQMVKDLDPIYNLYRITEDLNTGAVNPTELAFLAYGQHSGVPRKDVSQMPFIGLENEKSPRYGANPHHTLNETPSPDVTLSPEHPMESRYFRQRVERGTEITHDTPPNTRLH